MVFKNVILALIILSAFITMIWLGHWQMQRLEWKNAIISQIEANEDASSPLRIDREEYPDYTAGYIVGQAFQNRPCITIAQKRDSGEMGKRILCPFQISYNNNILVDYGLYDASKDIASFNDRGFEILKGYLKSPARNKFTPENIYNTENVYYSRKLDEEIWYWPDLKILRDNIFGLDQMNQTQILHVLRDGESIPKPRNKHAQYAIFWFGMAGILVLLTIFAVWKQRRK